MGFSCGCRTGLGTTTVERQGPFLHKAGFEKLPFQTLCPGKFKEGRPDACNVHADVGSSWECCSLPACMESFPCFGLALVD